MAFKKFSELFFIIDTPRLEPSLLGFITNFEVFLKSQEDQTSQKCPTHIEEYLFCFQTKFVLFRTLSYEFFRPKMSLPENLIFNDDKNS